MADFDAIFEREDHYPSGSESAGNTTADTPSMEAPVDAVRDEILSGLRIGVVYRDVDGARTHRIVRLLHVTGTPPNSYLGVHCELRNAYRTLLASNVEAYFDPATGELIDFDLLKGVAYYVEAEVAAAPEQPEPGQAFRAAFEIIKALRHELGLLVTVARADKRYRAPEIAAIQKYAEERALDRGLVCGEGEREMLHEWIRVLDPAPEDLVRSVQELAKDAEALATIWEVSELIGEADDKITKAERAAIREIKVAIESHIH